MAWPPAPESGAKQPIRLRKRGPFGPTARTADLCFPADCPYRIVIQSTILRTAVVRPVRRRSGAEVFSRERIRRPDSRGACVTPEFSSLLDSPDEDVSAITRAQPGPPGALPISPRDLLERPSGDVFGWSLDVGMGWPAAELR